MALTHLNQILEKASSQPKKTIAVASAGDKDVLRAIKDATAKGMVSPILIGDKETIRIVSSEIQFDISSFEIIDIKDTVLASQQAVALVNDRKADILMKGMVTTGILLKAVVDKENGLVVNGLLSHFSINQVPAYHKLLAMTDAAMNIAPDVNQKADMIRNSVAVLCKLGYTQPKVAILCPVETVNPKIESTIHADELKKMYLNNLIKDCIVEGPLALDNAISKEAAHHKGITGEIAGEADLLITPDLNAGNILYKAMNFLAGGTTAAIITGAKAPIVLTSRADTSESKMYSIALACCM